MSETFKKLVELLKEYNFSISSIESFTGGLFAKSITDISGSSQVFYGSLVTYKTGIKTSVLGVNEDIIEKYGVVSKEVALAMTKKGKAMFNTDIVVSFTGNAGPTVCEDNKQVGECYATILFNDFILSNSFLYKDKSRSEIRESCVEDIAKKLIELLSVLDGKNLA